MNQKEKLRKNVKKAPRQKDNNKKDENKNNQKNIIKIIKSEQAKKTNQ